MVGVTGETRGRASTAARLLVLLVLGVGLLLLTVGTLGKILDPPTSKIQTYNGTTWIDGVCHVDEVGVLWCTEQG